MSIAKIYPSLLLCVVAFERFNQSIRFYAAFVCNVAPLANVSIVLLMLRHWCRHLSFAMRNLFHGATALRGVIVLYLRLI